MSKYTYSAEDQSLLTPFLYRFCVDPLLRVIPRSVPANIITLVSNSLVLIAFVIAYRGFLHDNYAWWFCIPLLVFSYVVGDCADGRQARRTGTGSPLGEYFDHFLDSFVTGLLIGIVMISFRVTNPILIFLGFFSLYAAQITAFWERFKSGHMFFAKLSTSEGILLLTLMCYLTSFEPLRALTFKPFFFDITYAQLFVLATSIATGITGLQTVLRVKIVSGRLLLHFACMIITLVTLAFLFPTQILYLTLVATLYNAHFIASILTATALKTREAFPDVLFVCSIALFFVLSPYTTIIQLAQVCYLAVRVCVIFAVFFAQHRQYWYWVNPKQEAS